MTHDELVQRATRWLRNTMRCYPVISERQCLALDEQPDGFGVAVRGTYLIECKRSLSDFYSDKQKPFRRNPAEGMGMFRYMLTPPGLIDPRRITFPHGWGHLEAYPKVIKVRRRSIEHERDALAEILLMRSYMAFPPRTEDAA